MITTDDELLEDVKYWKERAEAAIEKAAAIVESRMVWWRNSSDQRIRDGSENSFIAEKIRELAANG